MIFEVIRGCFFPPPGFHSAYKRADKKIRPVSTSFPEDCYVRQCIPEDPLLTLPSLTHHLPTFTPTIRCEWKEIPLARRGETLSTHHGFE